MSDQTPKTTVTATTILPDSIHPRRRIAQNFLVIWVDANIDQSKQDCQNTLAQLRSVANHVNIFTERDECIDFLTDVRDMKAFLIVGGTLGRQIVLLIHDIPQLSAIYVFCSNKLEHEQWANEWVKIKGIHTEIAPICASLQQAVKKCDQDSIAVSFVAMDEEVSNQHLDQLQPSFMYTQILKEILLDMKYDEQSVKDFTIYCRNGDYGAPSNITRFENEYHDNIAIWWYTFPSFIYSMLNCALRMLEAETIIKMGFFIRDLHHQIEELYKKQIGSYSGKSFVVYRGQGLSISVFEELLKTKGGLMSFNNFLSTSKNQEISFDFAKVASTETDMIGILFKMSINPSVSSSPFASIREVSYFETEEEILFSMHTVFRVGEINKIDDNNQLYEVELKLTSDDDQQLRALTKRIREETVGATVWKRLGQLLIKLSQFDKAEELYNLLLDQATDKSEKAFYYHQLGYIKGDQGDDKKAIWYYEQSLEICQKTLPANQSHLATCYNDIAYIYKNMGEYSKALSIYEKSLGLTQKTHDPNHPNWATIYGNIGEVYMKMGEYSKALSFYEKGLEIKEKTLPSNHPDLATSYHSIGLLYQNTAEYSKAACFFEKGIEIHRKSLPPNHPELAASYSNIASIYTDMGEYSKALSFYEKAIDIIRKTLPPNHPKLASAYNSISVVYYDIGEYSKALSFSEKGLEIKERTLPSNHPDLATSYNNIGTIYCDIGEYSKALSFFEKALKIRRKTLPPNHPELASSYNSLGSVYFHMEEYSKALSFYEKAIDILRKTLPPNHPELASSYNNIGLVYFNMEEYSKALPFYEKGLEIKEKTLPSNHPDLASSYNNIGMLSHTMRDCSKALLFYEKAHEILQKSFPSNHPHLASSYSNIGAVYYSTGEYSKALSYFERTLDIRQRSLPSNHPALEDVRKLIERVKKEL